MTVVLQERRDLTTANYLRVAWRGEPIELAEAALLRMADTRKAFLALLEGDPDIVVYGTTSAGGDQARFQLSREEQEARGRLAPRRGTSWGEPFPERVVRGIVFARLANWLDGHGAVRPELAVAVASLLDGRPLPHVPMTGNGGSGEVIALGHLFSGVAGEVGGTELKEPMELVKLDQEKRSAPPALEAFLAQVRGRFPTRLDRAGQSEAAAALHDYFTACTYSDDWVIKTAAAAA